ncbi:hypothetical protein BpHYR1_044093 [Brachionus plicatilis]|uniref:Uncharacterized protein n=1 Tax=Brachionus plicatilis TaxID=10195 RepID=A0A3M7RNP3_BRAPC|nr:hypothetical protein BpHYR1_044093 [Brachionus plicatilis]
MSGSQNVPLLPSHLANSDSFTVYSLTEYISSKGILGSSFCKIRLNEGINPILLCVVKCFQKKNCFRGLGKNHIKNTQAKGNYLVQIDLHFSDTKILVNFINEPCVSQINND